MSRSACLCMVPIMGSLLVMLSCTPGEGHRTTELGDPPEVNDPSDSLVGILGARIRDHIQAYAEDGKFSGSVLVAKKGVVLCKEGFGFADYAAKVSNRTDTKFLIGSTTKSITAITLLRLYDRGLVDLQAPISTYLPGLKPSLAQNLTLDLLLSMKSGLSNHLARLTQIDAREVTTDDIIEIINTADLTYEPGTAYSYSNLNYHLIAAVIEKIKGMSYAEVLDTEIFDPLGMHDSGSGFFDERVGPRALGYFVGDLTRTEENNLSYALGSGSVFSTVEDLFKLDQALYDDELLSGEAKSMAFDGGTEEFGYYGYGFRIREYDRSDSLTTGVLVRHGGMMKGYLANVHRYLDDRITVIVLGNISMFPIRDLTTELKDIALGKKIEYNASK